MAYLDFLMVSASTGPAQNLMSVQMVLMNMQVMLHIELYGSINYDPCLGSSVRFSPASPPP